MNEFDLSTQKSIENQAKELLAFVEAQFEKEKDLTELVFEPNQDYESNSFKNHLKVTKKEDETFSFEVGEPVVLKFETVEEQAENDEENEEMLDNQPQIFKFDPTYQVIDFSNVDASDELQEIISYIIQQKKLSPKEVNYEVVLNGQKRNVSFINHDDGRAGQLLFESTLSKVQQGGIERAINNSFGKKYENKTKLFTVRLNDYDAGLYRWLPDVLDENQFKVPEDIKVLDGTILSFSNTDEKGEVVEPLADFNSRMNEKFELFKAHYGEGKVSLEFFEKDDKCLSCIVVDQPPKPLNKFTEDDMPKELSEPNEELEQLSADIEQTDINFLSGNNYENTFNVLQNAGKPESQEVLHTFYYAQNEELWYLYGQVDENNPYLDSLVDDLGFDQSFVDLLNKQKNKLLENKLDEGAKNSIKKAYKEQVLAVETKRLIMELRLSLLSEIVEKVATFHKEGRVVDLNPSNILVTKNPEKEMDDAYIVDLVGDFAFGEDKWNSEGVTCYSSYNARTGKFVKRSDNITSLGFIVAELFFGVDLNSHYEKYFRYNKEGKKYEGSYPKYISSIVENMRKSNGIQNVFENNQIIELIRRCLDYKTENQPTLNEIRAIFTDPAVSMETILDQGLSKLKAEAEENKAENLSRFHNELKKWYVIDHFGIDKYIDSIKDKQSDVNFTPIINYQAYGEEDLKKWFNGNEIYQQYKQKVNQMKEQLVHMEELAKALKEKAKEKTENNANKCKYLTEKQEEALKELNTTIEEQKKSRWTYDFADGNKPADDDGAEVDVGELPVPVPAPTFLNIIERLKQESKLEEQKVVVNINGDKTEKTLDLTTQRHSWLGLDFLRPWKKQVLRHLKSQAVVPDQAAIPKEVPKKVFMTNTLSKLGAASAAATGYHLLFNRLLKLSGDKVSDQDQDQPQLQQNKDAPQRASLKLQKQQQVAQLIGELCDAMKVTVKMEQGLLTFVADEKNVEENKDQDVEKENKDPSVKDIVKAWKEKKVVEEKDLSNENLICKHRHRFWPRGKTNTQKELDKILDDFSETEISTEMGKVAAGAA